MAPRKTRKDKGSKRELTELALRVEVLAESLHVLTGDAKRLASDIEAYDQRDRLTEDKK